MKLLNIFITSAVPPHPWFAETYIADIYLGDLVAHRGLGSGLNRIQNSRVLATCTKKMNKLIIEFTEQKCKKICHSNKSKLKLGSGNRWGSISCLISPTKCINMRDELLKNKCQSRRSLPFPSEPPLASTYQLQKLLPPMITRRARGLDGMLWSAH